MTLLVENFFNHIQNPTHVLTAEEEAPLHEVEELGNNRRNPFSYWAPTTSNAARFVKADCGVTKTADTIAIDRESNLAGKDVTLERSADDAIWTPVFGPVTIPATSAAGSDLTASPGILTTEGAWIFRFGGAHSDRYWRLTVAAGGAGFFPNIGGLFLGPAFLPATPQVLPHHKRTVRVGGSVNESRYGWVSFASSWNRREATLHMKLDGIDAANAQTFFDFWKVPGAAAWIAQDDTGAAELSILAIAAPGTLAELFVGEGWFRDTLRVQYIEHEPALL